jgi:autotransporter-associated beta strand protein
MKYPLRSRLLFTPCLIAAMGLSSLGAADFTWNSAANPGLFTAPANWLIGNDDDGDDIPDGNDNIVNPVQFGALGLSAPQAVNNFLVSFDTSSWSALGTSVSASLTISGTLSKSGTGSMTFRRSGVSALAVDAGTVTVSNGALLFGSNTSSQWVTGVSANTTTVSGGSLSFIVGADSSTPNDGTAFMGAMTVNGTGIVNVRNGAGAGTVEVSSLSGNDSTAMVRSVSSNLAASGTLKINSTVNSSYSGSIANGTSASVTATLAVWKTGNFTQTLTGANTYSGGTTVSAGTLLINNASGSGTGSGVVEVGVSGTLGGNGAIAGATTVDGTLAPGNSPGSLEFGGALTLENTAKFNVEIAGTAFTLNGAEEYDRIKITGLTSLNGELNVALINGFTLTAEGQLFGIVDATGGLSGSFSNLAEGGTVLTSNGYDLKITYTGLITDNSVSQIGGNDVVLYSVAVPEASTALLFGVAGTLLFFRRRSIRA